MPNNRIPKSNQSNGVSNGQRHVSLLVADTKSMELERRKEEQKGAAQFARVNARDKQITEDNSNGPEGELQNTILQHPALDKQRFDGIDPNMNPEPPLNTDARREYDNAKRNQAEKQLQLNNVPKPSMAPKPRGP